MSPETQPSGEVRPPAAGRLRRPRLLWTLLAVLLPTSLAPLFLTAYKLIDINRESLEAASREYQLEVAGGIVQDLNAVVRGARHQLSATAHVLGSQLERTGREPGTIRRDQALAPYLTGDLALLRYTSGGGMTIQVGDETVAAQEALSGSLFEAFATAMGGEEYLGRPLHDAAHVRPFVVAAVPVRARGETRGVLAGLVDLGRVWERSVSSLGSHYIAFALDDSARLFASAGMPGALREEDAYRQLEIVSRFRREGAGVIEIIPFEAPPGLPVRELLGARAATETGWGIFVLVDRGLAYASVAEMRRSVYQWALFAVVLAVAAAVVSAGAVTRPLKVLVDRTRRIAQGDFSTRADVRARNEIGELAETFNLMTDEIRNHIDRIKKAAEENNQLFLGTIKALAAAIDEKDPYTRGHSERVNRYSLAIARRLGVGRQELRNVTVGALLHDIGKIGIEDAILRKPASLSDKEFEIMKRHPLKGAHILSEMPQMKDIIPAMRNHHERWSGGGYPDNLKGEEIPLIARIVQVADTFDAMTTNRPYQRAMRMDAAVARINELSGIVFDPRVVAAFKEAWVAGDLKGDPVASAPAAAPAAAGAGPAS
ncbi:MAG TPA: HD domain-containing phosphohydrolase [Candidatus Polarisedimenticolia bacterium]|nr:HD domain-containing phosphohydrolase [Candidatus Polarisedimenticolia bacterium]